MAHRIIVQQSQDFPYLLMYPCNDNDQISKNRRIILIPIQLTLNVCHPFSEETNLN